MSHWDSADSADTAAIVSDWDDPLPFASVTELPSFPEGVLPGWLEAEVRALATEYQVPADLPAVISLSILSTCCAGRATVSVRGSWREPVNLYCFVAAESGTRKSPVFADMTRPLIHAEKQLVERVQAQIAEAATMKSIAMKQTDAALKKAASDGSRDSMADAIVAASQAAQIDVPVAPRVFADDVTPEALISLLSDQKGRMSILSAEAGIFGIIAGRYSSQPNLDVFLKAYSGEDIRVDRKGRPPEYVSNTALTLGVCAQPSVLSDIARIPGARGRGLLARVLYSLPKEMRGYRLIITDPVPDEVSKEYQQQIATLLLSMAEWTDPMLLQLSPEALSTLIKVMVSIEPRLRSDTGSLAGIADWASKFAGNIARIAALLHLAQHLGAGYDKPISDETMKHAVAVGDYFLSHALAAFGLMNADPELAKAKTLLRWIDRQKCQTFTIRDMFTGISRSVFHTVDDLGQPLKVLEDHCYIRKMAEPDRPGPGRKPSPSYAVNPNPWSTALSAESAE